MLKSQQELKVSYNLRGSFCHKERSLNPCVRPAF